MFGWVISKRVRRGYNNAASEGYHALLYLMIPSELPTLLMAVYTEFELRFGELTPGFVIQRSCHRFLLLANTTMA